MLAFLFAPPLKPERGSKDPLLKFFKVDGKSSGATRSLPQKMGMYDADINSDLRISRPIKKAPNRSLSNHIFQSNSFSSRKRREVYECK